VPIYWPVPGKDRYWWCWSIWPIPEVGEDEHTQFYVMWFYV